MNKKGFTLMELLAVIVILALLALIANSSVTNVVKNSKSDLYAAQIELIKSAAETWGSENIDKIPEADSCSYLTLNDLKEYGLFEEKIINPKTNKEFKNDLKIKLTSKITESGLLKTTYEIDPKSIKDCNYVYPPMCTLAVDNDSNSKVSRGDKYTCKVTENMPIGYENGYTFYVLNNNGQTIDLILEGNICENGAIANAENPCKVSWGTDAFKGPVNAMDYLYNSTKNWHAVPDIKVNYEDPLYGSIKTEDETTYIYASNSAKSSEYKNLKARMPYDSEMGSEAFITLNLSGDYELFGYWLANTSSEPGTAMFQTISSGTYIAPTSDTSGRGVRPVISLSVEELE